MLTSLIVDTCRRLGLLKKPAIPPPVSKPKLSVMDEIELLRNRLIGVGWRLKELPMGKRGYRLIAVKKERSFSVDGVSLHEAFLQLSKVLGVA
jgi:hypothetical protein